MNNGFAFLVLCLAATAIIVGVYASQSAPSSQATLHPKTTAAPLKPTTPHPKTTAAPLKPTTPHPNTTAVPLNTTTPHPNTTAIPLNTTTPHPNTTAIPLNTTTPHPNTTTPHTTTVPPRPTPPTNITVGNYSVSDQNNTFIMAKFAIKIYVNDSEVNGTFIVQPSKTNATGSLQEKISSFFLSFNEGQITMKFRNNLTSKMVYVETLEYELNYAFKSGVMRNYTGKNESLQLFAAAAGHSYSCKTVTVFMGKGVHLEFTQSRVQAYNIKKKEFGKTDLCKADQPDYRVPIAVAIILILLIIIVVIAYCVSRKRRTSGYQSL